MTRDLVAIGRGLVLSRQMANKDLVCLMNIYVGNLPYSTTETELRNLFANYGEVVSAVIITDRYTGRSKGFGFVEMANQREGETAIAELDGYLFNGRNLRVNMARPRTPRPRRRNNDWY